MGSVSDFNVGKKRGHIISCMHKIEDIDVCESIGRSAVAEN